MTTNVCKRCKGTGFIEAYSHIDGGRCWGCRPAEEARPVPTYTGPVIEGKTFDRTVNGIRVVGNYVFGRVEANGEVHEFANLTEARTFATAMLAR